MGLSKRIMRFENAGYYFLALVVLVLAGFWPSYFGKMLNGTGTFTVYFHFHTLMASLWILCLILQPIFIRQKKVGLHRLLGRMTYLLIPLLFLSIILLSHHTSSVDQEGYEFGVWITFKDMIVLGTMYTIAIYHRRKVSIHSRAMIAAGMVLIEPALVRFVFWAILPPPSGYPLTLGIIYLFILFLIWRERNAKKGRWVFPLFLGLLMIVHSILVFEIPVPGWKAFATWFIGLPLT